MGYQPHGSSVPCKRPRGSTCTCNSGSGTGQQKCYGRAAPLTRPGQHEWFCGRGGQHCPSSHYCHVHPTDAFAVCCPTTGNRNGNGNSIVDQKCHPVCSNGRDRNCMHRCAQCVIKTGDICVTSTAKPRCTTDALCSTCNLTSGTCCKSLFGGRLCS